MTAAQWFRRLGDVPGVEYNPPLFIDRSKLPDHDALPTVNVFDFDGRRHEALSWKFSEGLTSQSPASRYDSASPPGKPSADLLKRLYEVLELPGTLTDYHFAIQGCAGKLWGRRRDEPNVVTEVENLSWLDIRLLEAHPDLFHWNEDANKWPSIFGFGQLIRLYSREGYIREALAVATRACRFQQHQSDRDSLQQQLNALEAEAEL